VEAPFFSFGLGMEASKDSWGKRGEDGGGREGGRRQPARWSDGVALRGPSQLMRCRVGRRVSCPVGCVRGGEGSRGKRGEKKKRFAV
jgi:hypothetical protein